MNLDYKIDPRVFERLPELIRKHASPVIRAAALQIEDLAKDAAPVDTGALKASIYTVTAGGSSASGALAAAASLYTAEHGNEPPMDPVVPGDDDPLRAVVAVGVEYGKYVEFGAGTAPAQPFLNPAAATVAPGFQSRIAEAIRKAIEEASQ